MVTSVARAIETHPILVAMRAALLANSTIAGLVAGRIYPSVDVRSGAFPFIDYGTVSDVTQGTFSHAGFNDLIQFTPRDRSPATTTVVTLAGAIQTALLDTPWSVAGWALIGVTREEARLLPPEVVDGVVFQSYPVTVRVQAIKT